MFDESSKKMTNAGLELPRMKLDFSANLKTPLEDIGELIIWANHHNHLYHFMIIIISIIIIIMIGIHKLFSGEANKDFSPLTSQWENFVLDTLQHKAVLKVLPHLCDYIQDHD